MSRVLSPFVQRVVIANPLQVKAIAHAHVKTDKVDAGTLAAPEFELVSRLNCIS